MPLRVEVRVDDKGVILEPAAALGKADAVLTQHRCPKELVRAEQPEGRGAVLHGEVLAAPSEDAARHLLPAPDDLSDHDVRLVLDCAGVEPLERFPAEPVVVVDEVHELALRRVEPDVARVGRAIPSSECGGS